MSVTLDGSDEPQKEVTKKVRMLAYPKNPDQYEGNSENHKIRLWADEMLDADCFETYTTTNSKVTAFIQTQEDEEYEFTIPSYKYEEEELEKTIRQLERGSVNRVRIEREHKEEVNNKFSTSDLARSLLSDVFERMPEELTTDEASGVPQMERQVSLSRYGGRMSDFACRVTRSRFTHERVLQKESERTETEMYEGKEEIPTLALQLKLVAPSEDLIEIWTNEFVKGLHTELSRIEQIGRVRYTSCEITESREGECFDF